MRIPTKGLSRVEDKPDYVADIIFIQNSGGQGYDILSNQSSPDFLPSLEPWKYRSMVIQYHFDSGSSKSTLLAAGRLRLDLQEARKNTATERPIIFISQTKTELLVLKNFLNAVAQADMTLPIANVIGFIYVAHARDRISTMIQQQTVLAASQPCQLDFQHSVNGLASYLSLTNGGLENDTSEHEILCFYGRANLKVIMDSVSKYTPKFSTGGRDIYYLQRSNTAVEYISAQISGCVNHILRVMMRFQRTSEEILRTLASPNDTYAHAVIARLSQSFKAQSVLSHSISLSNERHFGNDWLLKRPEYIAWRESDKSSFFWLSGSPGSGKSTLTSYVIKNLENEHSERTKNHVIAFFIYDSRYRVSTPASMVLRQIICGLLPRQKREYSRRRLQSILKSLEEEGGEISISQLRSYFTTVQGTIEVGDRLVLVLDGLDEVEEPERILVGELLRLAQHEDVTHPIKCFLSGSASWWHRDVANNSERIDIDEEVRSRPDLDFFIKSEVLRVLKKNSYALLFYERLTSSSDGIFCRAILALRNLWHVDISDNDQVLSFINSIPQSLATAYYETLFNISEADRKKTFRLFTFVTYTFRPLRISELLDTMNFDMREIYPGYLAKAMSLCDLRGHKYTQNDILRLSGGLLVFGEDQTVNFIHNSARDFIITQNSQPKSDLFCLSDHQAHEMLSKICFYSLQARGEKWATVPLIKTSTTSGFKVEKMHYFTEYAIQYWRYHYRAAETKSNHLPGLLQGLIQQTLVQLWHKDCGHSGSSPVTIFKDSIRVGMYIGAKVGSVRLVETLLDMGADPDIYVDFAGKNALHIAAAAGNLPVVNLLLERGARFDLKSGVSGRTALQHAAAAGHASIIKSLLRIERLKRYEKASSCCEYTPIRTVWVACQADSCYFHDEQLSKARLGNSQMTCGGCHGTDVSNDIVSNQGSNWELPMQLSSIGCGNIDSSDAELKNHQTSSDFPNSGSREEQSQVLALEVLIQTLVQSGIDSILEYDPETNGPIVSQVIAQKPLGSRHLHLLIDVRDNRAMAQNWSRALKVAVQRTQEDSIRRLLEDEAVSQPKIVPPCSARVEDNSVGNRWSLLFDQAKYPASLTNGKLGYKKEREWSAGRQSHSGYSPE